jgi:hypothetical protein
MKEEFKKLDNQELFHIGIEAAKVEFIHRLYRELVELGYFDRELILSLLWECYFSICSPIEQTLYTFYRYSKARKSEKWKHVCQHDWEAYKNQKKYSRKSKEDMIKEFAYVLDIPEKYAMPSKFFQIRFRIKRSFKKSIKKVINYVKSKRGIRD